MPNLEHFRHASRQCASHVERAVEALRVVTEPSALSPGNVLRAQQIAVELQQELDKLVSEARHQLDRRQFADRAPENHQLTIEVGAGLVRALNLNDLATRRSFGTEGLQVKVANGRAIITGKSDALESLRRQCDYVAKATGERPLWHSASASSALRKLDPVLHR